MKIITAAYTMVTTWLGLWQSIERSALRKLVPSSKFTQSNVEKISAEHPGYTRKRTANASASTRADVTERKHAYSVYCIIQRSNQRGLSASRVNDYTHSQCTRRVAHSSSRSAPRHWTAPAPSARSAASHGALHAVAGLLQS